MANKPKRVGTDAETQVARYMRVRGWPKAKRNPLNGAKDLGDIDPGEPRLVVEVKAKTQKRGAEEGATMPFPEFLRQTEKERVNAGAAVGVCIVKPPGFAHNRMNRWWMLMSSGTFDGLAAAASYAYGHEFPMFWRETVIGMRKWDPTKVLEAAAADTRVIPDVAYRPGAKRLSSTGWDMRFLYLPDGLELLRLAGLSPEGVPDVQA